MISSDVSHFYLETPLYNIERFPKSSGIKYAPDISALFKFIYGETSGSIKLDAYCIKCKKESTFNQAVFQPDEFQIKSQKAGKYYDPELISEFFRYNPTVEVHFRCARHSSHIMSFTFYVEEKEDVVECTKVGQYPSSADLEASNLDKYRKILGKQYFPELKKAIGLRAHGVGAGSIVYLRRIIENVLIEKAKSKAKEKNENWDQNHYYSLRVEEKIKYLEPYISTYLVENRKIYGIVSKGIHDLSEEKCLEYFPVLNQTIKLALNEILKQEEEEKEKKELAIQLSKINKDIGEI